ncbi:MAG TPA: hypothetical protein VFU56_08505 [Gaiellaceae bacterium]|nr:hypothetical protein [Gaiellaceae bacterium]
MPSSRMKRAKPRRQLSVWSFLLWLVAAQLAALLGTFELARLWL